MAAGQLRPRAFEFEPQVLRVAPAGRGPLQQGEQFGAHLRADRPSGRVQLLAEAGDEGRLRQALAGHVAVHRRVVQVVPLTVLAVGAAQLLVQGAQPGREGRPVGMVLLGHRTVLALAVDGSILPAPSRRGRCCGRIVNTWVGKRR
ncbi:hypothetical protein GCM10020229_11530 [Kitasatospora albolonga]